MANILAHIKENRILAELLSNTVYIKGAFLVLMILQSCIYLSDILGPFTKFVLLYGLLIIVYDLMTIKNTLRNRYKWLLFIFCFFVGLSIVINFQNGLVPNVKTFLYLLFEFFVIAMVPLDRTSKEMEKEFQILSGISVGLLFVISLISLYSFIFQIQLPLPGHVNSFIGVSPDHRLFGISGNPNKLGIQMIMMLFLSVSCFAMTSSKKRWLLLFPVLTGLTCLMLSGSRGAQVAFVVGLLFFLFFYFLCLRKKEFCFSQILLSACFSVVVLAMFFCTAVAAQYFVGFLPSYVSADTVVTEGVADEGAETEADFREPASRVETDRVYSESSKYGSGRLILWEAAMEIFKHHPFFGVGNAAIYEYGTEYMGGIQMNGFSQGNIHNLYLQILASGGIFSFLSFLIMVLFFFAKGLKLLIRMIKKRSPDAVFFVCLFCGILMILTHQLFERQMIFLQSLISVWFALYLGYVQFVLQKNNEEDLY